MLKLLNMETKKSVIIKFGDEDYEVTGVFTPSWGGVMYYKDGSGAPPEAAEFDIEEVIWIKKLDKSGDHNIAIDVTDLVLGIANYYDDMYNDFVELCTTKIDEQ